MFILLFMIIIGAMFETLGVSAILPLVSAVTDPTIVEENDKFRFAYELVNAPSYRAFILYMAIALVILYAVKNVYLILLNMAQNHFTTNNERRMAVKLTKCYMRQEYLFHVEHNVAELQRNVNADVGYFIIVINNLLQLISELLVCGMLVVFLLIADYSTTIMLMVIWGLFLLAFVKFFKKRLKELGEQRREYSKDITKSFLEAFGGVKEIKAISKEEFFVERFDRAECNYARASQKQMLMSFVPKPIMESLLISGLLLFLAIRIALGADVSRFIPIMSVFAIAAIRMLPSFNRISGYLSTLMLNKASVDAVYKEINKMKKLDREVQSHENDEKIVVGDICIENLSFTYPNNPDKTILDNASLIVPHNKSVAFVGPSGAGKTTLADIILGILIPQKGKVVVGGVNVLENIRSWHEHIGYIPQTIFLTDDTIRANVAFGVPEKEIDDEKVWKALEEAQIADFIRSQEKGIDTNIGDRGVKLSGGQRQRIGIARALYGNPEVIVLDEATSALDNETEKAVMDAIYELSGKKTMIIIAHRLSTISQCNLVFEVKDGKVIEKKYEDVVKG